MSLRFRTERAFRDLLSANDIDEVAGDLPAMQLVTSQEASISTLETSNRVIIQGLNGQQVTPKTRNLRMRILVHVETAADEEDPEVVADASLKAIEHCQQVDRVAEALNKSNLAALLSAQGQADGGQFTCFGVVGEGEVFIKPEGTARILRTTWAYTCTVAQMAAS
jgi:hypothetical protein